MNPKERLIAAIEQRPVVRMPVMTYNFHPFDGRWHRNLDGTYRGPKGYQPMMDALWRTGAGMLVKFPALAGKHFLKMARSKVDFRREAGIFGLGVVKSEAGAGLVIKAVNDRNHGIQSTAVGAAAKLFPEFSFDADFTTRLITALRKNNSLEARKLLEEIERFFSRYFGE